MEVQGQAPWGGLCQESPARQSPFRSLPHVAPDLPAPCQAFHSAWESLVPPFQFLLLNLTLMVVFGVGSIITSSITSSRKPSPLSPLQRLMTGIPTCITTITSLYPALPVLLEFSACSCRYGGPHLLNIVSLHRSVLQSPTAHSEVSLDQGSAEHCSQEHGWTLESNLISPLHGRVT